MKNIKLSFLLFCLVTLSVTFFGCSPKTAKTPEEFIKFMEEKNYSVEDVSETYKDEIISQAIRASCDRYTIRYSKYIDSNNAKNIFDRNKEYLEDLNGSPKTTSNLSYSNFNIINVTVGTDFHIVARISDTLISCSTDESNRNDVISIFEQLGYK